MMEEVYHGRRKRDIEDVAIKITNIVILSVGISPYVHYAFLILEHHLFSDAFRKDSVII